MEELEDFECHKCNNKTFIIKSKEIEGVSHAPDWILFIYCDNCEYLSFNIAV